MNKTSATVFIVDEDGNAARDLARLLSAARFEARCHGSMQDFLARDDPDVPGCIVVDVATPGLGGLDVQSTLAAANCLRPTIYLTEHGNIPACVKAMRAGAVDFLIKPVEIGHLVAAVYEALRIDADRRHTGLLRRAVMERLATLTPRERQVLTHVVAGRMNKQIAGDLGTVVKTIKVHRARVMHKMRVRSLAQLVRLILTAGIVLDAVPSQAERVEGHFGHDRFTEMPSLQPRF